MPKEQILCLIANDGLHPIRKKLMQQFGEDIIIEKITEGNVALSATFAAEVARRTKDIVTHHDRSKIYVVFSGLPIYNLVIFETVQKVLNYTPIVLFWNRETECYIEFDLDVRKLIFATS